jgi:hypothetical protein
MCNKLSRYLKSKLYRLGVLQKKSPLFVITVTDRGFISITKSKIELIIFVSNIQTNLYDILLEYWIQKPHRTITVKNRSGLTDQNWYSRGKCINKTNYGVSAMLLERIDWFGYRE